MSCKTLNPFCWVMGRGYPQGVFWAILTAFVSVSNDVITKFIGTRLDGFEVSFFRFLFSMLTVLPFMLKNGVSSFKTTNPKMHWYRAIIGVGAIALYIYALILLPLAEVTVFSFTQPIFFMPLALAFLGERVGMNRWVAACVGFMGILVMINPGDAHFDMLVFIPMGAAIMFASLDILAKKMVSHESTVTLLFYFALGTTVAAGIALLFLTSNGTVTWLTPTARELFWLFALGSGANLIQVCLFKAFSATEASSLAPFRYTELIFAATFGYFFFGESLKMKTLLGATIIIGSTLYMSYAEVRRRKKKAA